MKPSTELFDLIKKLTKSEKRFFKLSSSIQAGDKNYFKLFDFIDKLDEYDEPKVKEHFKGETFIKHLPSEKNHLYKLILKSLRSFYGDQSISSVIQQEIKNIEILYNKALHKEAKKLLKRTKKMAWENELFYLFIKLISWEKVLTEQSYESGNFDVNLNRIIREEHDAIQRLRNLEEYYILYSKINSIFRSDVYVKNKEQRKIVDEIANHHLIVGKNTALSVRATSICYYIQGLCAITNRDFETSFNKFNKVITILDKNPKIKVDLGERYILTYYHLMHIYMNTKDYDKAKVLIEKIKDLKGKRGFKSLQLSLRINNILLTDQMKFYNLQGNFKKSMAILVKEYKSNKGFIEQSSKESKISFYFTAAYTLFAMENYRGALGYVNTILNDNEKYLRQDIYSFTRILNLLIHFERKNFDFLEHSANSALRLINKTKSDYKMERVFIKEIKRIAGLGEHIQSTPFFKDALAQINKLLVNEGEWVILDYINIVAWVVSKIDNISFIEAVKRNVERTGKQIN